MAEQTTILQLIFNHLGLENSISTMSDRIALQKLVCLTQEAGLQLGYSFNWYIRGPYSPGLASDYYQISSQKKATEEEAKKYVLREQALAALGKVRAVINVPMGVGLDRVGWLELLASVVFLKNRYQMSWPAVSAKIQSSKPLLFPYFDVARQTLVNSGYVQD